MADDVPTDGVPTDGVPTDGVPTDGLPDGLPGDELASSKQPPQAQAQGALPHRVGPHQALGPRHPLRPQQPIGPDHPLAQVVVGIRQQLEHLESMLAPELRTARGVEEHAVADIAHLRPAWQREHEGEERIPVALVILAAIGLQLLLPQHLAFHPRWLLPAVEGALLIALVAANPRKIDRTSKALRVMSITLIGFITLANGWSTAELVYDLVSGMKPLTAGGLLISGASIYLTNIIVFALFYWEWDRGGPVARALALNPYPAFLFANMTAGNLVPPDWIPTFFDYLYLSSTNATAFSPTDTLPLARWAKMLMLIQATVALITVALVVARAVNIIR